MAASLPHHPVLYQEVINALMPRSPGKYVDATVGAGGHAWGILDASTPEGRLLGLDRDPQALALASQRLSVFSGRFILIQAPYDTLRDQLHAIGWEYVDGILFDLGVSSMQLDQPERGFSFLHDGPLDMRFDPSDPFTASDLINNLSEAELADLIWRYGEERYARRIAHAIVQNRPLSTTRELAEVIRRAVGRYSHDVHPATRTFQALRIAVNRELERLEAALPQAVAALTPGGRLAVIAFHSLEDRLVKQFFRRESTQCLCPPQQPQCTCGHQATLREITRHPIRPRPEEVQVNPRARSARLRVAEKLQLGTSIA